MTNAQKWVAAFLVLFIALFGLSKITENEEEFVEDVDYYGESTTDVEDGLSMFRKSGCVSCHGADLQGTKVGPALASVKTYWDRDALINYLRNPSAYSGDDRFEAYRNKYKNIVMPAYSNLDVKDLGKMADYLLSH